MVSRIFNSKFCIFSTFHPSLVYLYVVDLFIAVLLFIKVIWLVKIKFENSEFGIGNSWKNVMSIMKLFGKGLSVNEDYNYLWAVHSFDVETFEFSAVLFLLLSSECWVSFYWGPARVNFDSSLFWNCIFTTEKNCGAGISNFNTNEF